MPVLTGADMRAARLNNKAKPKAAIPEIPVAVEVKEKASTDGYRMHHPDDPYHAMDCVIKIDEVDVQITRGVALVGEKTALELERRGWLRGAKVENYADFQ